MVLYWICILSSKKSVLPHDSLWTIYGVPGKKKKKQSTHNIKERKNRNRILTMVEEQWWRWNNGGALMWFVLTIETEHSQHVNAINFFFFLGGGNLEQWWRSSKRRDKGVNTKRRERALTIEIDYSQHQHVNVIFFFFFVLAATCNNGGGGAANGDKKRDKGVNTKRRERES